MALPKGYSIKKWMATDRAGKHPQYAAYFGQHSLNKNQNPVSTLKEAQKLVKSHADYELFKKQMGNKLDEARKVCKRLGIIR